MLDITWKAGKVTVVACKASPGTALYLTQGGAQGAVFFRESGIGVETFKSDDPPVVSTWMPMLTGIGNLGPTDVDFGQAYARLAAAKCR